MQPVRVAIVGTGNIARHHMESLRPLCGGEQGGGEQGRLAQVVAAADIDRPMLAAFCAEHGIPRGYRDLDDLLSAVHPDLVHVCTPPGLHHDQAQSCLQAGASVLVEKPPALSLRELDQLVADEGAAGPWHATVFQHRFGSAARKLRALTRAGTLGRPLLAICHTTWFRDQAYFDAGWRGGWDMEGGGPTMGHGIHQMDLLLDVLGDWAEVSAIARRQERRMDTEDVSLAHVTFATGAVASVVNSVLSPREESYLRFDFTRATIELTHLYGYGDDDWRVTPAPGHERQVLAAWKDGETGTPSGHRAQFAEVLRCLRAGTRPPVTLSESRRTLALVTAIYASAFTGTAIRPADLGHPSPFYRRMDGDGARW